MLRGGLFPLAYVYPRAKRQTRDLLRRRIFFVRQRAQLIAHVVNTNTQFNLPPLSKKLTYAANRTAELLDRFTDPSTRLMVAADLALIDDYDTQIAELERHLVKNAKVDDPVTFGLLRTVPGIGPILGLTLLYEIDDIGRFPEAGNFLSYSRLVRCEHSSAGKVKGSGPKKIGNAHLKWAFSEAACLMIRAVPAVKGVDAAAGEEAGQAQGPVGPGGEDRPGGVPPVAQAGAVRPEAVPEGLRRERRRPKPLAKRKDHERTLMRETTGPVRGAVRRTGAPRRPRCDDDDLLRLDLFGRRCGTRPTPSRLDWPPGR